MSYPLCHIHIFYFLQCQDVPFFTSFKHTGEHMWSIYIYIYMIEWLIDWLMLIVAFVYNLKVFRRSCVPPKPPQFYGWLKCVKICLKKQHKLKEANFKCSSDNSDLAMVCVNFWSNHWCMFQKNCQRKFPCIWWNPRFFLFPQEFWNILNLLEFHDESTSWDFSSKDPF